MIPGTMNLELLIADGQTYTIALYVATALITVCAARIADLVKDADAEKRGMIDEDGKGYPIESVWIPVLIGLLVVPFVWAAMVTAMMGFETAMVTAVVIGYSSREFLAARVAEFADGGGKID